MPKVGLKNPQETGSSNVGLAGSIPILLENYQYWRQSSNVAFRNVMHFLKVTNSVHISIEFCLLKNGPLGNAYY